MQRILILGAGGHAQVVADALLCAHRAGSPALPIGFLDDSPGLQGETRLGLPVLGTLADLPSIEHDALIIGIGDNHVRSRLFARLRSQGQRFATAVHPRAVIAADVQVGEGTVACAGAIVNTGSAVGENVILNTGCTVDHHNVIANHVHIAPGAHLGGDVQVGEGTLIGLGASVMPQRSVGAWSTVGAGALVKSDIPDGVVAVGVPARTTRQDRKEAVNSRIYLSSPHLSGHEQEYVQEAFRTNWVAPLGPNVDTFEQELCEAVGARHAVALSSGTAALHLSLLLLGVGAGDEVLVSTLTFSASVNPIVYVGARPVLVDSEEHSWNIDPSLLADALSARARAGRLPKAVVVVHLYGQTADMDPILSACARYEVPVVEDAAEALGGTYRGRCAGTLGRTGFYSFNGNKIITTSGGGMLVSADGPLIEHARKLATQARDPAPYYQHTEIGYNYRMSNVLAGIGRGQLRVLEDRVAARRRNFEYYRRALSDLPGLWFQPEARWGRHTRWLTCVTIDPAEFGADRKAVRLALEEENIEARPIWKPMHLQPIFAGCERIGGSVSERIFETGLCLPSGSNLCESDLERVVSVIRRVAGSRPSSGSWPGRGRSHQHPAPDRTPAP